MNVMGIMQQIMSNNRVMGNPIIKNAMSMVQSGNSKGIEQIQRDTNATCWAIRVSYRRAKRPQAEHAYLESL